MTVDNIDQFKSEGALYPIDILSNDEVDFYKNKLITFMDDNNWKLNAITRHKPHLYLNWANELAKSEKIIENIKPLLGDDILLWYSVLFVKPAKTTAYVPWHQDATYWALNKNEGLTLWLALSEVNPENGCVDYIPGSHRWDSFDHSINNNADNLLARGQEISGFDSQNKKSILLKPGQASIHDVSLLHSSQANNSQQPRLGIAFRYIPASNFPKTLKFLKRSATLVSGQKHHQYFIDDPNPSVDSREVCQKAHRKSVRTATIHTLFGDSARSIGRKVMDVGPTLFTKKTMQYFSFGRTQKKQTQWHSVLVTGASSGIGREFALQMAPTSKTMVLTGRNLEELKVTQQQVRDINPKTLVETVVSDLCEPSDRETLINTARKHQIDSLVLNAGGGNFGLFIDSDWQQEQKVIDLNIASTVHLCSKLVPQMLEIAKGRSLNSKIILVSSHAAFMRIPNFSVYASCKAFLNHFGLTLVQELKDEPIDIVVSCPGATESKFSQRAGLPKKMLSTPLPAQQVVRKTLAAVGSQNLIIITPFDRILFFASRILPVSLFDRIIFRTQKKLLKTINRRNVVT